LLRRRADGLEQAARRVLQHVEDALEVLGTAVVGSGTSLSLNPLAYDIISFSVCAREGSAMRERIARWPRSMATIRSKR